MRVEVTTRFLDKFNTSHQFIPGEVVDFEEERAKDIIKRGLGKAFEPIPEEPKVEMPKVEEPKVEEPKPKKPRTRTK